MSQLHIPTRDTVSEPHPTRGTVSKPHLTEHFVEPTEPQPNQRWRRETEWAVACSDLPPATRVLLRVVLLHQSKYGGPCIAEYRTLAREASLSQSALCAILRRSARAGIVDRMPEDGPRNRHTSVLLRPSRDDRAALGALWARLSVLRRRMVAGTVTEREEALMRWACPEEWARCYWSTRPEADEASFVALETRAREEAGGPDVNRFGWIREVVADRSLTTLSKGVALAADLLMARDGVPLRWIMRSDLAALSGYSRDAARRGLGALEAAGWIRSVHVAGREGGLLLRASLPPAIAARWEREKAVNEWEEHCG